MNKPANHPRVRAAKNPEGAEVKRVRDSVRSHELDEIAVEKWEAIQRLKKIVKHLAKARLKCGCVQCVGSPNHLEPCDDAIEALVDDCRKGLA